MLYSALCRSPLGRNTGLLGALRLRAHPRWRPRLLRHVFSGRGAFIHVGALIGTIMAANVFMVIIPNQRKITAALLKGETPDPQLGAIGKQRSLHNTYLTLPVLLMMISNHYPMITDHAQAWVLAGLVIIVGGALLRHFLVRIEVGDPQAEIAWTLPLIGAALAAALFIDPARSAAGLPGRGDGRRGARHRADALCHLPRGQSRPIATIKVAPKGIALETLEELKRYAAQIETQAVKNKAMPLGNKTGMTARGTRQARRMDCKPMMTIADVNALSPRGLHRAPSATWRNTRPGWRAKPSRQRPFARP